MATQQSDTQTDTKKRYKNSVWYYNNSESYREKAKKWSKDRIYEVRAADPEAFNEKQRDYIRNKYQTDPAYRERQKARALARYYAKKAEKSNAEVQDPPKLIYAETI
jgi:hypothetical protein